MNTQKLNLYNRLDIFVRILYIKAFLSGEDFTKYRTLYKKNVLLATGGKEWNKVSFDDYEASFQKLIHSIKSSGYIGCSSISIDSRGDIIDGAHRVACCLYFSLEATYTTQKYMSDACQDITWFRANGFQKNDILDILFCAASYIDDTIIYIIWPYLYEKRKLVINDIQKKAHIIGTVTLTLPNKNGIYEFVKDLYSNDIINYKKGFENIEKKAILLMHSKQKDIEVCLFQKKEDFNEQEFKEILRDKYKKYVRINQGDEKFFTFHAGDGKMENMYMKNFILKNKNIESFSDRRAFIGKNYLEERLFTLNNFIHKRNIQKSDICIVGSAILDIYSLRKSSDLDVISLNNEIIEIKDNKNIELHQNQPYSLKYSNQDIIEKHSLFFRGFKYISPGIYYEIKKEKNRKKDIKDIALLFDFLKDSKKNKKLNLNSILFKVLIVKKIVKVYTILLGVKITQKLGVYKYCSYLWRRYILKRIKGK